MPPPDSRDRVLGYGGYFDGDGSSYGVDSLTSGFRKGDATALAGTATRAGALLLLVASSAFLFVDWASHPDALVFPGEELPIGNEALRQRCSADHAGYSPKTPVVHAAVVASLSVVGMQAIVLWVLSPQNRAGDRRSEAAHADGSRLGARRGAALGIGTILLGVAQHAIGMCQCVPAAYVAQGECGFFIDPVTVAPAVANYVNLLLAFQLLSASPQGVSRRVQACVLVVVAADWFGSVAETMRSGRRAVPALVVTAAAAVLLVAAAVRFGRLRAEVAGLSRMRPLVADAILDEAPSLLVAPGPCAAVATWYRGSWCRRQRPGPHVPTAVPLGTAVSPDDGGELGPLAAAVAAGRLPARDALQLQAALSRGRLKAAGTLALAFLGAVLLMDGALFGGVLIHDPDSAVLEAGWIGISVARDVLRFAVLPTVAALLLALVQAEHNASRHAMVRKLEAEERKNEEQLMLRYGARRFSCQPSLWLRS